MPFADRVEAGNRLADYLEKRGLEHAVVLALPRGGASVAAPIAQRLKAPLDLLLVRKVGVPGWAEVAMGAVSDGSHPVVIRNADVLANIQVPSDVFDAAAARELAEIERRSKFYFSGRQRISPKGRIAIVVDDGAATGATLKAALEALRRLEPARIVVALPVAPASLVQDLRSQVDDIICLEPLGPAGAVGAHYGRFEQLSDDDVLEMLDLSPPDLGSIDGS